MKLTSEKFFVKIEGLWIGKLLLSNKQASSCLCGSLFLKKNTPRFW